MAALKSLPARAATPAPSPRPTVEIGCRWKPDLHSIKNDRDAGVYEEVNSQIVSKTEEFVQRALLAPITDPESIQRIEAARVARRVTNGAPQ